MLLCPAVLGRHNLHVPCRSRRSRHARLRPSNATYALPLSIPAPMSSTLFLMCCWNFWKHRNMSSPFVDGGQTSLVSTGTARLTLTSSRFAYHTNMCMEAMHGEPCPWRLNKARGSHPQKGDGSHSLLLVQV
jgi:hypothetical protein